MLLTARQVCAGYGTRTVLRDISVDLRAGEVLALLGANGSGKSTLVRCLSGLLHPTAGTVEICGENLRAWSRKQLARTLTVVPQLESPTFDYSVRDVVMMGRYAFRASGREAAREDWKHVESALALTDTTHLSDRSVTTLSGGEYRRVLLARALAQKPRILLLDEPTAHLDLSHQTQVLEVIQRLARDEGVAVLAALHDFDQAARYCDSAFLLHEGRELVQGSLEQVLTPDNLQAAFGAAFWVTEDALTGRPHSVAAPLRANGRFRGRAHVVAGGGTAAATFHALLAYGYEVTAGVLDPADNDAAAASVRGIDMVMEAPFTPVTDASAGRAGSLMRAADLIAVCPCAFGPSNIRNLELVRDAQRLGKLVLLIGGTDFTGRDHCGGRAAALLHELVSRGATIAGSVAEYASTHPEILSQ